MTDAQAIAIIAAILHAGREVESTQAGYCEDGSPRVSSYDLKDALNLAQQILDGATEMKSCPVARPRRARRKPIPTELVVLPAEASR